MSIFSTRYSFSLRRSPFFLLVPLSESGTKGECNFSSLRYFYDPLGTRVEKRRPPIPLSIRFTQPCTPLLFLLVFHPLVFLLPFSISAHLLPSPSFYFFSLRLLFFSFSFFPSPSLFFFFFFLVLVSFLSLQTIVVPVRYYRARRCR